MKKTALIKAGRSRLAITTIVAALTGPAMAVTPTSARASIPIEIAQLQKTAKQLAQEVDLSSGSGRKISAKIKKSLRFQNSSNHIALVPVVIRYEGLKNRFCRLIIQKNEASKFIDAPAEASSDNCVDIAHVIYADLNRDGYPDAMLRTVVPSNRYGTNIVLPQVYISDSQGEYCYGGPASRALQSDWDGFAQSALAILDAESTRLGLDLMQCTPR